ncbi:MAG TPA: DUF2520 domain-containing protein [Vicinamibacterales bacterium]|nr:DUF2520 domain-containing protein [Vicinamibacterales bacterium]
MKLFEELQDRFRIPASAAHPYLMQMTANIVGNVRTALTGPLVRRDAETIAANLTALEGDPFHDIYAAFVRAYERRA